MVQRETRGPGIFERNGLATLGDHRLDRGAHRLFSRALHVPYRLQVRARRGRTSPEADLLADVRELPSGFRHQFPPVLPEFDRDLADFDLFRHAPRRPLRLCLGPLSTEKMERHFVLLHLDSILASGRYHRAPLRDLQPDWRSRPRRARPQPAWHVARIDSPLHRDELTDRYLDAALILRRGASRCARRRSRRWC